MIVGYLGQGALSEIVAGRLAASHELRRLPASGAEQAAACDVIVVAQGLPGGIRAFLGACGILSGRSSKTPIVVDQTVSDPEQTRLLASELQAAGITLVDAPLQCEQASRFPQASAILCGGAAPVLARVLPLLEAICPKVIHFGEVGSGHAARLLVGAIAACNRMITYECAALGFKNGLSVQDMATVLNRSSGQNSATELVLPYLADRQPTADAAMTEVAAELRLMSQLAMRANAPVLLPNLVAGLCQSLANQLPPGATFDDVVGVVEQTAGVRFA